MARDLTNDIFSSYTVLSIEECNEATVIHKLSHQHLHIQFWKVKIQEVIVNGVNFDNVKTFPFPIVIFNFIEKSLVLK